MEWYVAFSGFVSDLVAPPGVMSGTFCSVKWGCVVVNIQVETLIVAGKFLYLSYDSIKSSVHKTVVCYVLATVKYVAQMWAYLAGVLRYTELWAPQLKIVEYTFYDQKYGLLWK